MRARLPYGKLSALQQKGTQMGRRILVINGHPDPREERFCAALAAAYEAGACEGGHELRRIDVGGLAFPLIRTAEDFEGAVEPPDIIVAQEAVQWADHLVFVYPLWLGEQPALLKGFLEQVFRYGFALGKSETGRFPEKLLTGRTAHLVVTMGMPAPVFRWWYGAHSVRALELSVLRLCGIKPIRRSLIGMVDSGAARRTRWLARLKDYGRSGR
jgi:putative NADPH-quinone reductase